jgi:hypothetical protein
MTWGSLVVDERHVAHLVTLGVIWADSTQAGTRTSLDMLGFGLSPLGAEMDFAVRLAAKRIIERHTNFQLAINCAIREPTRLKTAAPHTAVPHTGSPS